MNYTREQAEEVLRDWNEQDQNKRGLSLNNVAFLDHKFPKKVSGWYRTMGNEAYLIYFDFENNNYYGFDSSGLWCLGMTTKGEYNKAYDYLVTPQEVEQRLIEEADRRYKIGDVVISSILKVQQEIITQTYNIINNHLFYSGIAVFNLSTGEWAEIIEQPETELSKTIKKAEKIVDKLNHLLSLERS